MAKKSFKNATILFLVLACVAVVIGWHFFYGKNKQNNVIEPKDSGSVSVHFVDVGQGDCEVILSDGKTVLIDAGERDKGNIVVKYLKNLGIEKLDYVIATHPHTDHIGGLNAVINNYNIETIIMPEVSKKVIPTNETYKKFLKNIKDKNVSVKKAKKGDVLNLGDGNLKIIGPIRQDYEGLNDYSVGALFSHSGISFLLCGDMEKAAEKDVLDSGQNIKADVFKLSHHGSRTSNTKKFLEAVNPRYCVAEVGAGNIYSHPSRDVLKTLEQLNINKVFRTDLNGNIIFTIKDKKLSYKIEKGEN